jgi:antitoxin YefM
MSPYGWNVPVGKENQKRLSCGLKRGVIMNAIYQGKADELDQSFLDAVKTAFKDKEIEIMVSERDETAYLLRSPANREHLLSAIKDIEQSQNTVTPDQDQFQ